MTMKYFLLSGVQIPREKRVVTVEFHYEFCRIKYPNDATWYRVSKSQIDRQIATGAYVECCEHGKATAAFCVDCERELEAMMGLI